MNSIPCCICSEAGHRSAMCPTLYAPLKSGFYAPPAGHRPSGDEEDEKIETVTRAHLSKASLCLLQPLPLAILSPIRL
jgi:hypothetical protein